MLRYYPSSKILANQNTDGFEYQIDGVPYRGKYYKTYDGKIFSGPNPQVGPSKPLKPINRYSGFPTSKITINEDIDNISAREGIDPNTIGRPRLKPTSYFPQPIESDYKRGYLIRYFTKKENETIITEISEQEYNEIVNGKAPYDIRRYQTQKILWKITGPLNSQRQSQYNVIPGIIDTNKRLTETANKTFLGIVDFIGGDYAKFSRLTV